MTQDYPDFTRLMQIIGTEIMIPFDIQGANIMLPMDLQGANITLDINIKAKAVTLTVDIEAQQVGIFLQPDWYTEKGTSKGLGVTGENLAIGGDANVEYEVKVATALFITQISCYAYAYAEENRDLNQACAIGIGDAIIGGMGGCQVILPTPLKFLKTETVTLYFFNRSNHTLNYYAAWRGYEI